MHPPSGRKGAGVSPRAADADAESNLEEEARAVWEAALVALAVAAMAAVALVPWTILVQAGALVTALGLALGVPGGVAYHLRLRAALRRRDALPPRWWVEPVRLHRHLSDEERRRVLPPFTLGAAGFVLTMLGCALVLLGVLGLLGFGPAP